jgi:hypothetical protein
VGNDLRDVRKVIDAAPSVPPAVLALIANRTE